MNPSWIADKKTAKRSRFQCVVILSSLLGNFSQRQAAIADCCSAISHILFARCPSAIIWAVWSVIVYAINLVFWRGAHSHVVEKTLKRLAPTVAHNNASGSISFEAFV